MSRSKSCFGCFSMSTRIKFKGTRRTLQFLAVNIWMDTECLHTTYISICSEELAERHCVLVRVCMNMTTVFILCKVQVEG